MATSPKPCPACRGSRYVWACPVAELTIWSCGHMRERCPSCDSQGQLEHEPVAEGFPLELPPCAGLIGMRTEGVELASVAGEIVDGEGGRVVWVAVLPRRIQTLELAGGVF